MTIVDPAASHSNFPEDVSLISFCVAIREGCGVGGFSFSGLCPLTSLLGGDYGLQSMARNRPDALVESS